LIHRNRRSHMAERLATASAVVIALAQPAWAQTTAANPADPAVSSAPAAAADTADIGEIVVTAQFRAQRLQDTPIAITAVNSALMEARSQTNITQIADQAPNVTLKPNGASFGPSIVASIRGIGQGDFNPALEPGVGIYVDDVYYATVTGAVLDLLDLDRVEILRGPQGTLTGRNSEGGAIKLFSKKPNGSNTGYVEGTYGSRDRIGLRASADFTLADNLYARLSGVFKQQDGYVDQLDFGCVNPPGSALNPYPTAENPSPVIPATRTGKCRINKLGGIGYTALRGIVRYAPTDTTDFVISADYNKDSRTVAGETLKLASDMPYATNPALGYDYGQRFACGRYCNYASYSNLAGPDNFNVNGNAVATSASPRSEYEGWGISGTGTIELSDNLSLVSITAYRQYHTTFASDDDLSPSFNGLGYNDLTFRFFSQELRLNGKVGDLLDYTLGGYYNKQKSVYYTMQDIRYINLVPGLASPLQLIGNDPVKANSKAAFANVAAHVADGLTLSGGLRYTDEYKSYHFERSLPTGSNNLLFDLFEAPADGLTSIYDGGPSTRLDYRVSLDYRVTPELLVYGSVSTGFKGGGTSPRPFNAAQVMATFDPETLTAYELGFKSDLFDRMLRLNVSTFYNVYKKIQGPLLVCPEIYGGAGSPCGVYANIGNGHFKGFEAESTFSPVEGLSFDASLSYITFKYTKIDPLVAASDAYPNGARLDDPFAGVPKWKWSFGAQYQVPLGDAGSITPRIDVAYQGKLYQGRDPSVATQMGAREYIPSYTIANARLTYRNPANDWEVSVECTNLFDKYYILTQFDLRGSGAGLYKVQPARPREFAVTVKKTF